MPKSSELEEIVLGKVPPPRQKASFVLKFSLENYIQTNYAIHFESS
jgi:hypothetical protein